MPPARNIFPAWLALGLAGLGVGTAGPAAVTPARPNILVILADDIGWGDAGCYGAIRVQTPNIDRLAREGLRFENGYSTASVCTPTRFSLLTGEYGWRTDKVGVNRSVSNGATPLLIPTDKPTAPGLLQQAGYRTAVIGKWHLGFGLTKPDYNAELRPGPLEVGFHEYFGFPATNDRIPTVLIRDRKVLNLDPADPLVYTYDKTEADELGLSRRAAGRDRIGWGKGGQSAWWDDTRLAELHARETIEFLERNQANPFFLYYAPHSIHAPIVPSPRFEGASGLTPRADLLVEFDHCLGEILQALDRLNLAENTLVIYSSDNGAYAKNEDGHRPTGPFRGIKSTLWEGGSRVPFVVRWPARITPGVATDLVSTMDIPAVALAAAGLAPAPGALRDSVNLLPSWLGEQDAPRRDFLVLQGGNGALAVRSGPWKFIPDLDLAEGWGSKVKAADAPPRPGLYDLSADPGETQNLATTYPAEVERLAGRLATLRATTASPAQ